LRASITGWSDIAERRR